MSDLRAEATRLYIPGVFGYKRVGKRLGVGGTTIKRWLDPDYNERHLRLSREAKRRRQGICEDCGGPTRYGGGPCRGREHRPIISKLCAACSLKRDLASKVWTREAIIEAIQRWAKEYGRPPSAIDWKRRGENHPASSNVYRSKHRSARHNAFASWAEAIEAAGFERPENGGRYRERPWLWKFDHAEAMRILDSGVSRSEVARRLGVSLWTIHTLAQNNGTFAQVAP